MSDELRDALHRISVALGCGATICPNDVRQLFDAYRDLYHASLPGWQDEVLAEVAATLATAGCCHGHGGKSTPPMMYPEWILCAIKHAREESE